MARRSEYEGKLLVEEFKREINTMSRSLTMDFIFSFYFILVLLFLFLFYF